MSERLKRILLISGFLLVVFGIAVAIYLVFFGKILGTTQPVTTTTGQPTSKTGLPSSQAGQPSTTTGNAGTTTLPVSSIASGGLTATTQLTSSEILAPTLSADGKRISYYDPTDGKFYTIDSKGNVVALSTATFPNAKTIVWDRASKEVVVEFPDNSNVIYNFDEQKQTTLPAHWEDFNFSPDGTQVIAKNEAIDPNARSLVITNTDTSGTKAIESLGQNSDKVQISWSPNDQVVAFSATGTEQTGFGRKMIVPIGKNKENFTGLIVEGLSFHANWTPDGARIVYDVTGEVSDYKPLLWIVDGTSATMGKNRRSLGVNTWIDKCAFASSSALYCAVPITMNTNAGLQPDLLTSDDAIYTVNIDSGNVTLIGVPETSTQMSHLVVSTDGSLLYYTDKRGRLQFMRLK